MAGIPPIPQIGNIKAVNEALSDMVTKLDQLSSFGKKKDFFAFSRQGAEDLTALEKEFDNLQETARKTGKNMDLSLLDVEKRMKSLSSATANLAKDVGTGLVGAFDKFGKVLISTGLGVFDKGIQALSKSIHEIWRIQEAYTKAMGAFKMQIGGVSPGMAEATKFAGKMEGQIRGLTDTLGQGTQMAADFIEGFGRMGPSLKEFGPLAAGIARGFNLGGKAAGQFIRGMEQLGQNRKEVAEVFGEITAGAKAANVPVNMLAKEISENRNYLVSFGKEGQKTFLQGAAWVKKMGVELKSLKSFGDLTDTFDDTAKAAAKLNTVFGTSINALDMMLENDPSKRLDMVRTSMLSQGKTFEQMTRHERSFMAETLKISEEELAGVLKSGKTLEEFRADQEKTKAKQIESEKLIRNALAATAQTMFAFGAAWEKIYKAISQAIKPFTDLLGLTKSGDKQFKSFGQVMSQIFGRLEKFILEVAKNKDWQNFMKRLAGDAQDLAKKISAIATGPGLGQWLKTITKAAGDFYDLMKMAFQMIVSGAKAAAPALKFVAENLKTILGLWLGMKVAGAGMGMAALGGGMMAGGLGKMGGVMAGGGHMLMGAAAGGLGGYGISKLHEKISGSKSSEREHTGAAIGGAIGGGLGALLGPVGMIMGTVVGSGFGKLFAYLTDYTKKMSKGDQELSEAVKKRKDAEEKLQDLSLKISIRRSQEDNQRSKDSGLLASLEEAEKKNKQGKIKLEEDEAMILVKRINALQDEGRKSAIFSDILNKMTDGNGPLELTSKQLKALKTEFEKSDGALKKFREEIDKSSEALEKSEEKRYRLEKMQAELGATGLGGKIKSAQEQLMGAQAGRSRVTEYDVRSNKSNVFDAKSRKDIVDEFENMTKYMVLTSGEKKNMLEGIAQKKYIDLKKKEVDTLLEMEKTSKAKMEGIETKHLEKLYAIRLKADLMENEGFKKFRGENASLTLEQAFDSWLSSAAGQAIVGKDIGALQKLKKHASGGIFNSPTAGIIGEAGAEAVIPLSATAGGYALKSQEVMKAVGGIMANTVNGGAGGGISGGNSTIKLVAGDVYLDGQLVGRHIVRDLITNVG